MIKNKTIFIAHNWSDASVSNQSKTLAIALSENNRVVFLNAKKNGIKSNRINDNLLVLEWPNPRPTGWNDLLFAIKLMRKYRPDMIITNFAANDIMLFTSWIMGVTYRLCYFHTMVEQYIADHGALPFRQKINIFRKSFVFRMATHMLPCSGAARKDLLKYFRVKQSKAFVFPNALPDTGIRNQTSRYVIGFLGRLDPSKGADILVEAFAKVIENNPDVVLELGGRGSAEPELRQRVNALCAGKNICFKGIVPYTEVLSFLSQIHFLVVPSRADNLPTVILEAFSVATPVIGSNAGGIPEMVIPGFNGLLFENGSAEDLARNITDLLTSEDKRRRLGMNARKTFEERFCVDGLADRLERLIEGKTNGPAMQNVSEHSIETV